MHVKLPRLNLQHIITFYCVAAERSFSGASERLFVTQSAVTQQIRTLETQFGVKLFYLKKQKTYLTHAGERLFVYADEFVHQAKMMETFLKTYRLTTLHLGVSSTLMHYVMPVINRFKEIHPSVQVSVREGVSVDLAEQLLDFKHDICFVGQAYIGGASRWLGRVTGYRIPFVEKVVFVAAADYPIRTDVECSWEDLARQPLILPSEGASGRRFVLAHFSERGLRINIGAEVDNIECTRELVRRGKGVAVMFWPNARDDVVAGKLKIIPIVGGDIRFGVDILLNPEVAVSPLAKDFVDVLRGQFDGIEALV